MTDVWPVSLPQAPLQGTLSRQRQDNLWQGPAAIGVGQRRAKASASSRAISFAMNMTAAQLATLDTFFVTTLGQGSKPFTFTDPVSGDAKEFYFAEPYQDQHVQADAYRVTLSLIGAVE